MVAVEPVLDPFGIGATAAMLGAVTELYDVITILEGAEFNDAS